MNQASSNLDILRSAAVLLVFFDHLLVVLGFGQTPALQKWGVESIGHFGVFMFFIHTSLVLMFSLERLRQAEPRALLRRFYVRRAFRIYPLSILVIVLALVLRIPSYFQTHYTWPGTRSIVSDLFLVQNLTGSGSLIGPLWSLPYEVQSYLALPFLYMAALRVRSYMGALLLCAMGVGALVLEGLFAQIAGYPLLLIYAPWFFMGAATFSISRLVGATIGARWYVVSLGLFVSSPLLAIRLIHNYRRMWVLWAVGSIFAIALPHFRNCTAPVTVRACGLIARYSYGIYLTHVPILWFVFRKLSGEPQWLQLAVLIALLALVPAALYHAFEAPMIRAGAALAASLARRSNVPVAILAS